MTSTFSRGGDNACRYRYYRYSYSTGVDYLYPTTPENLLEVPAYNAVAHPERYHGCIGWTAGEWLTFRLEIDIRFCREAWSSNGIPQPCHVRPGRVRYWLKYAADDKPWLVVDYPLAIRWRQGHSERFGRFMFLPYNTGEKPMADKPAAFTMYDDVVIARNVDALPWPMD